MAKTALNRITAVIALGALVAGAAAAQDLIWVSQFGTGAMDEARAACSAGSGACVAGFTQGVLPGQTYAGGRDAFVRRYDAQGDVQLTRQFGTSGYDHGYGVAAADGAVYVAGVTDGLFPGQSKSGPSDAFVWKGGADGEQMWVAQFGGPGTNGAWDVAADSTAVYVAGFVSGPLPGQTAAGMTDAFVRKYDADGVEQWTDQFGTVTSDEAYGVCVSEGGVYVVGCTRNTLDGQTSAGDIDAFIRKYDADGSEAWTRQFGTWAADRAYAVCVGAGGVYVAGSTYGTLAGEANAGSQDAFVRKYDGDGNEAWTVQFGTPGADWAYAICSRDGWVYAAGSVDGALPGQESAGARDAFVRALDLDGNEVWTTQFGSSNGDEGRGVAADADGVYVAGSAGMALPDQQSLGSTDAFLAKLNPGEANQPPVAEAGDDQAVEQGAAAGAEVALDGGGSSDPDDDPLTYTWTGPFPEGGGTVHGVQPVVTLPLGANTVTLVVNDGEADSEPDTVEVTVEDTMPPSIAVDVWPKELWPPNNQLVPVQVDLDVSDICDAEPSVTLEISTNDLGQGFGRASSQPDWLVDPDDPSIVWLRAERLGSGSDRVYTLTWTATDDSGNTGTAAAEVTVKHDQGKRKGPPR